MKPGTPRQMCRQMSIFVSRRRQMALTELLRHARIVSDPKKMAALKATVQVEKELGGQFRIDR